MNLHPRGRRRSASVTFQVSAAAAIAGASLLMNGCDSEPAPAPPPSSPPRHATVSSGKTYANNDYIEELGYYHAPYHAWFQHRYNEYDPVMGYYYNGRWHVLEDRSDVLTSSPDERAAESANSALAAQPQNLSQSDNGTHSTHSSGHWWGGGWGRGWGGGTHSGSSSPSSSSTSRGGFGGFFSGGS